MIEVTLPNARAAQGFALVNASKGDNRTHGYFLAFPGNAQTATELLTKLRPAAAAGFDVVVFDYANLLGNGPLPRLHNLIADARIVTAFYAKDKRYEGKTNVLYGASTGGLILIQALPESLPNSTTIILDSVPDRIPRFLLCDKELDPIQGIAAITSKSSPLLVLNGTNDQKVLPANSRAIAEAAERTGGCHTIIANATHPFESTDNAEARIRAIVSYAKDRICQIK